MNVQDLYFRDICQKRGIIQAYLKRTELTFRVQNFQENGEQGINFIVLEWEKQDGPNIVITSHYDGCGAYDNAGGVVAIMWLMKWMKLDNMASLNRKYGFIVVFTDREERGLLGAKYLLKNRAIKTETIYAHLSVDGFGIGTNFGAFANTRKVRLKTKSKVKTTLTLQADTTVFQEMGLPSLHLFTLPKNELLDLVHRAIFPDTWLVIHTTKDTPERIDNFLIPYTAFNLYKKLHELDFNKRGILEL